jgi:hypothetical protein
MKCVYSAVRTDSFYKADTFSSLQHQSKLSRRHLRAKKLGVAGNIFSCLSMNNAFVRRLPVFASLSFYLEYFKGEFECITSAEKYRLYAIDAIGEISFPGPLCTAQILHGLAGKVKTGRHGNGLAITFLTNGRA